MKKMLSRGVEAIWNLFTEMEMAKPLENLLNSVVSEQIKNKILTYSQQHVSLTSGIIRFLVKPGEIVKKSQPRARIYNAFGKLMETVKASEEGIVLGYADSSVAFPGSPVMSFGNI